MKKIYDVTPAGYPCLEVHTKGGGYFFVGAEGVELGELLVERKRTAANTLQYGSGCSATSDPNRAH